MHWHICILQINPEVVLQLLYGLYFPKLTDIAVATILRQRLKVNHLVDDTGGVEKYKKIGELTENES